MNSFHENIRNDYRMASSFSDFIYIVRTLYNVIVSDGNNQTAVREFERLSPDLKYIADIDIDAVLKRLNVYTNPMLRSFLLQIRADMKISDVEALKKHIKQREVQLKGVSRAKTAHPGEFDSDVWFGGGQLDYRFSNAKVILKDIFEAGGKKFA